MKLKNLQANVSGRGILPEALVTVVNVQWYGDSALELTYKDPSGRVSNQVLYRSDEARLHVAEKGQAMELRRRREAVSARPEAHRIGWRT